jgi:hypothetical protein
MRRAANHRARLGGVAQSELAPALGSAAQVQSQRANRFCNELALIS